MVDWKYPTNKSRKFIQKDFTKTQAQKDKDKKNSGLSNYYDTAKVHYKGLELDSDLEKRFYIALEQMEKGGYIKSFEYQVKFDMIPTVKLPGMKKANRKMTYKADFVVYGLSDERYVIDAKGYATDVFKIKKKLFEWIHKEILHTLYNVGQLHELLIGGAKNGK